MYTIAKLNSERRKIIFDFYSTRYAESAGIAEKDFWVTLMLDYIFHISKYKDYFIFKGGTSLSKCFNIINRFSEDIDLILNWNYLGLTDEEIYSQRSNTNQLKYNKYVDDLAINFIESKLLPDMINDFKEILGYEPKFEQGENKHILNFYYPNIYDAESTGVLQCIRLEIGPLAERIPVIEMQIEPLISKINLKNMIKTATTVKCISPERTFWEKVLILHQEAHRPKTKIDSLGNEVINNIPRRYSRHYYDVWKIGQTKYKEKAFNNLELLERVRVFKKKFYRYSWDNLENAFPGLIKIIPDESRIDELKVDFEAMKLMLNDDSVNSFDDVINGLKQLENEINNLKIQ